MHIILLITLSSFLYKVCTRIVLSYKKSAPKRRYVCKICNIAKITLLLKMPSNCNYAFFIATIASLGL